MGLKSGDWKNDGAFESDIELYVAVHGISWL